MRSRAGVLLIALLAAAPASAEVQACSAGCPARSSLSTLARSPGRDYQAYDNARAAAEDEAPAEGTPRPPAPLAPAQPQAGRPDQAPPPSAQPRERFSFGSFVARHKWDIAGGIAGAVTSFLLGGLLGLLVGIVVSIAVSYLGRKLERGA